MMLKNDFYSISNESAAEQQFSAEVQFNAAHEIFAGHFPGQPVVPGVCMMQITKESMEGFLNKKLEMLNAPQIKFLTVIDPRINSLVQLNIQYKISESGNYSCNARLSMENTIYFKMVAEFSLAKDPQEN